MNKFLKDLLHVLSSNLVVLVVGIVNGFLVPKFLGIDEYAVLKTYSLYAGYVGILHLGFIDGIYLKYGGVLSEDINKSELKSEFRFILYSQFFIALLFCLLSIAMKDWILLAVSIAILPTNLLTFFKFYYQALGEFTRYAKINSIVPIIQLSLTLVAVFLIKVPHAGIFIAVLLIVPVFVSSILSVKQINMMNSIQSLPVLSKRNFQFIKIGFFIMIGNFASAVFFSMDRWFVKILLTVRDFAIYAFAVSLLGILLVFIRSIAMTFYPMLVNRQDDAELISTLKKIMVIVGSVSIGGYFILSFIVHFFLVEYAHSLTIILYLFMALPPIAVIHTIYVNLYKARKEERKYSYTVLIMVVVSFIANGIAVVISRTGESIAIATVVAFYIWFLYSAKDFPGTETSLKEIVYLVIVNATFIVCSRFLDNIVIGFFSYEILTVAVTLLLFRECISDITTRFKRRNVK